MSYSDEVLRKAARLMGRDPLNPIGTCFDATAHQAALGEDPPWDLVIVHGVGWANMPDSEPTKMGHAWLEWYEPTKHCRVAMDCVWGVLTPAKKYREDFKVEFAVEYTRKEFLKMWATHDYPGPWHPRIKEVMKD